MQEKIITLEMPILVSSLQEEVDECLDILLSSLQNKKGVIKVHIDRENQPAQICLHFNPNIISLGEVQKIAKEAGSDFNDRYRHEQIPFSASGAADSANNLVKALEDLSGMLHSHVNYVAGIIYVAYDSTLIDRAHIEKTIFGQGFTPLPVSLPGSNEVVENGHDDHDHGSAPVFLPHWLQERWEITLMILAGIFFLLGWLGEIAFDFSPNLVLAFFVLSYLAGGYDIATHAIPGLLKGQFDTDVLMIAAAVGAALLGEWTEGAFLLFLFSLGHAGEHYALDRARNAVNSLGALMPQTALVKDGIKLVEKRTAEVMIDDIVIVRPGDRIPVDGRISFGKAVIDQSAITGESMPVEKSIEDEVFAGTINLETSLEIKVTKLAQDNTLSRVMQMVTEAQSQQSPTQQFTQRFTAWFVPTILVLVLLVVVIPSLFGWMPLNQSFYRGMLLLVAASPCALAIGTPASILTGIAQAARNGVLIKGGIHLENLGTITLMAFDKTGTLTEGRFKITEILSLNGNSEENILRSAAAVEQHSNHPLAIAIVEAAQEKKLNLPEANGLDNLTGRGVRSEIDGQEVLIGSLKLFKEFFASPIDEEIIQSIRDFESNGNTAMLISKGEEFLGIIALADTPRKNIKQTLGQLRKLGIKQIIMLTGDNELVAQRIGKALDLTDIRADLLPIDKLNTIKKLQKEHNVAMVGDGVNDAPALASATVGIAMGGAGTAVALETADIALMADDLGKLPFAVGLSRASKAIIRQNLWISLGVIGLLIVTSVSGWLQLSWAVVLHEGSTILVVLNALRLLGYQLKEKL